jgi:putative transposase
LGLVNLAPIPHSHPNQLLQEEVEHLLTAARKEPEMGYRKVCYEVEKVGVYLAESTAYRHLRAHGLIISREPNKREPVGEEWKNKPTRIHEFWHTDITYIWVEGYGFRYLFTYMDGYSRYIIHAELRRYMTVDDTIETLRSALKKVNLSPDQPLRLVTDNGAQYTSKRFKQYLKQQGVEHIRTAYKHPETNGKIERYHRTLKEKMRLTGYRDPQDAENKIHKFNQYYNTERFHQKLGYVTPEQKYLGKADQVISNRRLQREKARQRRRELNRSIA